MANELFDAVLSGSMDEKKELVTKMAPTDTKMKAKKEKSRRPASKLSIYVGNFPWVSITVCVGAFIVIAYSDAVVRLCRQHVVQISHEHV